MWVNFLIILCVLFFPGRVFNSAAESKHNKSSKDLFLIVSRLALWDNLSKGQLNPWCRKILLIDGPYEMLFNCSVISKFAQRECVNLPHPRKSSKYEYKNPKFAQSSISCFHSRIYQSAPAVCFVVVFNDMVMTSC